MKIYKTKFRGSSKRGKGEEEEEEEPIAKFEYSIRRNVLRKMMQPKWS